jgi:hypothetical protein
MFVLRGNSQSSCNPLQRWPDRIEAITSLPVNRKSRRAGIYPLLNC